MWKQMPDEGAGAILYSKLCLKGFKLPCIKCIDHDEKILLDLEVKLKLKHDTARKLLWSVIVDYPPSLLLWRPDLLKCLVDLIGAPFSHEDVHSDHLGIHAVGSIYMFQYLLVKLKCEVVAYLEGDMCSMPPNQLSKDSLPSCGADN
jgi:hypothetical protein